jgi:DNA-binding SARP family transcriptional activator
LMIPVLRIRLLGDFLLVLDDAPLMTINSPRLQSLLAYLVLHHTAPQDRSHLAFLLWPDSTEAQAHTNLRQLLYHLRQAFPDTDRFLHADKHNLWWRPTRDEAPWMLDVLEFEQALEQAEQAEQTRNTTVHRQALEQATQLYRGNLLPGCYDEWLLPERERLRLLFLRAAARLIEVKQQERDYDDALMVAQRLLHHDPLHEPTYQRIMNLYAVRGDRAGALRTYHTCTTVMERELGTEPGESTRKVYEALMQSVSAPDIPVRAPVPGKTAAPLVGRKEEWVCLQEAWRKVAPGQPHIILLTGEAGIGKTRLAEEMEFWVSRQGKATAKARCYDAEGRLAYAPVTTWLRSDAIRSGLPSLDPIWLSEVARLMPDLLTKYPKLPHPAAMTEEWQRQHFFEALARAVLSARPPLLLLIDDLQWCDNETLTWLHFLFRFEPTMRLLLIGTVRSEEILPELPLVEFLTAMQRDRLVTECALKSLTAAETASLAEHILLQYPQTDRHKEALPLFPLSAAQHGVGYQENPKRSSDLAPGHEIDAAMISRLYAETEGNPLFVVEMARAGTLEERTDPSLPDDGTLPLLAHSDSILPTTIQTVLKARLAQLSPTAREVANVAAIIGREFPFSVVAQACGKEEDTVIRGLDELWQRRIVREQNTGAADTYYFSHDKLREQVYISLSPTYRRLLHRRVAEALEEVCASDLDAVSGQIAVHFERAGHSARAIPYYRRAGEAAMRIYANEEAIAAFEHAATLLEAEAQQEQHWEIRVQIYESLGDVFIVTGQLQEAREAYQRAMTTLPTQEAIWHARLQRKMANAWNNTTANPRDIVPANAQQAFQEAGHILAQVADQASIAWQHEWIELQFAQIWPLRGTQDEMTARLERVRPAIEQYGTQEQRELLGYALGTLNLIRARYVIPEQMIPFFRQMLATIQQTGNRSKIGTFHFTFGIVLLCLGHPGEAEEQLESALHVGEQLGLVWLQIRSLTFLPFIYRKRGQVEQVRSLLTRAQEKSEGRKNSILSGHRAWIAWRDGKLIEAEAYGRASLEEDQAAADINIFRWVGIWPLLGVALVREDLADAMSYARMLLDPGLQLPAEQVRTLLEAALQARDAGQQEEARVLLQQVVSPAKEMGYL